MSDYSFQQVVNRLQYFMNQSGMNSSQFADTCGISRSNLSQIITGRTKSINDIFLAKITDAFPNLNIAWLLFGKGNIIDDSSNIEISEPQNKETGTYQHTQNAIDKQINSPICSALPLNVGVTNLNEAQKNACAAEISGTHTNATDETVLHQAKKIERIMVLYSDGTFESFFPK